MEGGRREGIKGRRGVQLPERLGAGKGFRDQLVKPRVTGKVEAFGGGQHAARRHDHVDLRGFAHKGKPFEAHQAARRHDLGDLGEFAHKVHALGRDQLGKPHGFGELGGIAPNKVGIDQAVKRLHIVELREVDYKAQRFEANQVGKPHLVREVGRVAPKKVGDIGGVGPKKVGDRGRVGDIGGVGPKKVGDRGRVGDIGGVGPKKLGDRGTVAPKKLGDIGGVQPARHHAPGMIVNIEIKKIIKVEKVFKLQNLKLLRVLRPCDYMYPEYAIQIEGRFPVISDLLSFEYVVMEFVSDEKVGICVVELNTSLVEHVWKLWSEMTSDLMDSTNLVAHASNSNQQCILFLGRCKDMKSCKRS